MRPVILSSSVIRRLSFRKKLGYQNVQSSAISLEASRKN